MHMVDHIDLLVLIIMTIILMALISPYFSCTNCGTACFLYVLYIEAVVWYIAYAVHVAGSIGEMQ